MIKAYYSITITVTDPIEAREAIRYASKLGYVHTDSKASGWFEDPQGETVTLTDLKPIESFGKVRAMVAGIACEGRKKGSTVIKTLNLKPVKSSRYGQPGTFYLVFSPQDERGL